MVNILTAIGNPEINDELKNKFNVIGRDIQYKEGILEILDKNLEINYIIINQRLNGNITLEDLIKEIKKNNNKIKIIVLINENDYFNFNKSILILKLNKNIINEIIKEIEQNENINNENKINKYYEIKKNNNDENNKLNFNFEKNNNCKNNKLNFNFKKNNNLIFNYEENNTLINKKNNVISINGANGVGKTINTAIIGYFLSKKKYKILLIDVDEKNGNLHTIFQINKNINLIQEINNNLYFINTDEKNLNNYLNDKFDFFIIDNLKNNNFNFKNIILFEGNLIGISKLKNKYNENCKNKIIILNKKNKYSIEKNILKNIFENKNILEINYSDKFNLLINNFKIFINDIYFKKQYKKIIDKLINKEKGQFEDGNRKCFRRK